MTRLPDRASAEEARMAAGLPVDGWRRYLVRLTISSLQQGLTRRQDFTQDIARAMRQTNPSLRWRSVSYREKCEIMVQINTRLADDGLPPVGADIVGWRMSRVLGNLKHSEGISLLLITSILL